MRDTTSTAETKINWTIVSVAWRVSKRSASVVPIISLGYKFIFGTGGLTKQLHHNNDVIMTWIASQITSLTVVYSIVYSDADQRKHQSSALLAFVWGIHRDRWIPRAKGQLRGKCFHLMTSSWHSKKSQVIYRGYPTKRALSAMHKHGG